MVLLFEDCIYPVFAARGIVIRVKRHLAKKREEKVCCQKYNVSVYKLSKTDVKFEILFSSMSNINNVMTRREEVLTIKTAGQWCSIGLSDFFSRREKLCLGRFKVFESK